MIILISLINFTKTGVGEKKAKDLKKIGEGRKNRNYARSYLKYNELIFWQ